MIVPVMFISILLVIVVVAVAKLQVANDWHEKWFDEFNVRIRKLEPPKESDGYVTCTVKYTEHGTIEFTPVDFNLFNKIETEDK